MALVTLILNILLEFLRWKVLELQVRVKTLLYDLKGKIDAKEKTVRDEVRDLNAAGRVNDADQLLNDFLGQSQFVQALQQRVTELQKGSINPNS